MKRQLYKTNDANTFNVDETRATLILKATSLRQHSTVKTPVKKMFM